MNINHTNYRQAYSVYLYGDLLLGFRSSTGVDDPEKMTSYELGYVGHWPRQALTLDIKLYREEVEKVIDNVKDTRPRDLSPFPELNPFDLPENLSYTTGDIGNLNVNGFELQLSYRPSPATFLILQYAYADPSGDFVTQISDEISRPSTCPENPDEGGFTPKCKAYRDFIPEQTYSLLGGYRFDSGWEASLGIYGMSAVTWLGDGDAVPSYTRVDGRIARKFKLGESKGDVALVMQNLG